MDPGAYVKDVDDDDPDLAVVLKRTDAPIDDIPVDDGGRTVADDNPEYDASESGIVVAFIQSGLDNHCPEWTDTASEDLYDGAQDNNVKCYTFPESRLTPVSDEQARTLLTDTAIDMDALRSRLEDAGWEVESAPDGSLVAEKLGDQYEITPAGEVHGNGRMQEPLENLVAQYSD